MDQGPFTTLPDNLPAPADDGACNHLAGRALPRLGLVATDGRVVSLWNHPGRVVVYVYPMTGRPGVPLPEGWDAIPGARGCTPESCGFRDHHGGFAALGATVFGLSTQDSDYQREARDRLHLPFELLSDADGAFGTALGLPTFVAEGRLLLRRVTLICRDGAIEQVFYPVFPPDSHAATVLGWLQGRP